MNLAINRSIRQIMIPLGALICLTACGSQDTTTSYDEVGEIEGKPALGADFLVPYYEKAKLFSVKRSVSSFPASVSVTGSFHSQDDPTFVCDNYSRLLRMDGWVVSDIEKTDSKSSFKAKKDKAECTMSATSDGSQTTVIITSTK